jgi:hypothetical protein
VASWIPPFYAGTALALTHPAAKNTPFKVAWFFREIPEQAWSNVPRPRPLFATGAGDFKLMLIGNDIEWVRNIVPEPVWRPALRRPNGVL